MSEKKTIAFPKRDGRFPPILLINPLLIGF